MSSGLFYLTDKECSLVPQERNRIQQNYDDTSGGGGGATHDLVHRIKGVSIIFFYSISCQICKGLLNDFKTLPGKVNGVSFGIANVSANNMRLQQMSEASATPIKYVPYIVVYVDGKYYLEYRGPKKIESIARAAFEIASKINTGKEFSQGKVCHTKEGQGYCVEGYDQEEDEDMCYTNSEIIGGKVCDIKTGKCYVNSEIL